MIRRREFLAGASATLIRAAEDFPLVDYHVHLNARFSLDQAVALSKERGVKFGIAEHAGDALNRYSNILTDDAALERWMALLDGKGVYKGIQAEWINWPSCFSREVVARLDYVLSDAMTMPDQNGNRVRLWTAGTDIGDPETFMDRYVRWNVQVIESEPLDIFAHPTWLPAAVAKDFDSLWTEARMKALVTALKRTETAVEIDAAFRVPRMPFLRLAKAAGLKFAFGSNSGTGPVRGMEFCVEQAKALGLTAKDMFVPASRVRKPIMRRKTRQ
jgi:histidinol phosphatase-like PHP family hydrolase